MKEFLSSEIIEKIKPWFLGFELSRIKILVSESSFTILISRILGVRGVAWWPNNTVYIVPKYYQPKSPYTWALIAHECEHLRQHKEMGWGWWMSKYLFDRIFLILKYLPEIIRSRNVYLHYGELPLEKRPLSIESDIRDFYQVVLPVPVGVPLEV